MKKLLAAMFVGLLMVGCADDSQKPTEDSSESDHSSVEMIDLDDKETLDKIIAEAINGKKLRSRSEKGENLKYLLDDQKPYTGWVKQIHKNGQIIMLGQFKDGKPDGYFISWYENGQTESLLQAKNGKRDGLMAMWYENGQKKSEGNFKDGKPEGLWMEWEENGQKMFEGSYMELVLSKAKKNAVKNLNTVYQSLAAKTRSFPMARDVDSIEKFVVWWRGKTKDTRPEHWFIGEDDKVKDLDEDSDGPGIPSNIPDDAADFHADQVKALGYCVAIPLENAKTKYFVGKLNNVAYPIMWSRGLDAGDDKWDAAGTWNGTGGHVLFSNGNIRWYDDTKGKDGRGVFTKANNTTDGYVKNTEPTSNIKDALPLGWEIYKPAGDSPESNQSSPVTPPGKSPEVAKIDLDDNETRNRIIAEAIDGNMLQERGKDGEKLAYAPNQETPYTGWAKEMYDNGQVWYIVQYKDGKMDGLWIRYGEDGTVGYSGMYKDGEEVD